MTEKIYLDHHATTPLDPRVFEAMRPWFIERFGNAASRNHAFGWEAEDAVKAARKTVARAIGADADEIVFTSGATESNNLAIKGLARHLGKGHILTLATEHSSVLDPVRLLEPEGFAHTILEVGSDGRVDLARLDQAIRDDTILVSVMEVNNEIGVIQDLRAIGKLCRKKGVVLHSDGAQVLGRLPVQVKKQGIGLLSLSAHKAYGPKGVGALYVSKHKPRVRLQALVDGGGHENGLRSGTLNVPGIVGFAEAVKIAVKEGPAEEKRLAVLRDRLRTGLEQKLDHVIVNGSLKHRIGGNLNMSFAYVEGESLLMLLNDRGISVSTGSACTTATLEPSHVLKAIGVSDALIHSSIRFGLGRSTTEAAIDTAVEALAWAVKKLRAISPLADQARDEGSMKTYKL